MEVGQRPENVPRARLGEIDGGRALLPADALKYGLYHSEVCAVADYALNVIKLFCRLTNRDDCRNMRPAEDLEENPRSSATRSAVIVGHLCSCSGDGYGPTSRKAARCVARGNTLCPINTARASAPTKAVFARRSVAFEIASAACSGVCLATLLVNLLATV